MSDPSARITLVTSLAASPGHCAICGKSDHPVGFAATDNFDFEFYGTVYFCGDCIGDYARLFDYKSPSEMSNLESRLATQEAELRILREAVLLLESQVDGHTSINSFRDSLAILSSSGVSNSAPEPQPVSEDSPKVVEKSDGYQLAIDEPFDEQRSDDVRDITSTESIDELLAL